MAQSKAVLNAEVVESIHETKSIRSLDSPYNPIVLDALRKVIFQDIVLKHTIIAKSDYQLFFDPNSKNDISFTAGNPFTIILGCHPYDAQEVMRLAKFAFSRTSVIRQMRVAKQVVRQKDAAIWYGVDYESIQNHTQKIRGDMERSRYTSDIVASYVSVRVTDNYTGRSVTLLAERSDALTLASKGEQLLRESS